jgi:hypothetical protein
MLRGPTPSGKPLGRSVWQQRCQLIMLQVQEFPNALSLERPGSGNDE